MKNVQRTCRPFLKIQYDDSLSDRWHELVAFDAVLATSIKAAFVIFDVIYFFYCGFLPKVSVKIE